MTDRTSFAWRVALGLTAHAARILPPERSEWSQAMIHEVDNLASASAAVRWAVGCVFAGYVERMRTMVRSLISLPRWILALEMLLCFLPLTLLFSAVVLTGAQGRFTLQTCLLYCSGSVLGPLGLAAAFRSVFFKRGWMNRITIAALCLLAAWTLTAYSAQILSFGQTHLPDWWREFVLIAVLPAFAVLHLVLINSHGRGAPVAA